MKGEMQKNCQPEREVTEVLQRLLAQHGAGVFANPSQLEGLLRDLCGQHRREITVVVTVVKEGEL